MSRLFEKIKGLQDRIVEKLELNEIETMELQSELTHFALFNFVTSYVDSTHSEELIRRGQPQDYFNHSKEYCAAKLGIAALDKSINVNEVRSIPKQYSVSVRYELTALKNNPDNENVLISIEKAARRNVFLRGVEAEIKREIEEKK